MNRYEQQAAEATRFGYYFTVFGLSVAALLYAVRYFHVWGY